MVASGLVIGVELGEALLEFGGKLVGIAMAVEADRGGEDRFVIDGGGGVLEPDFGLWEGLAITEQVFPIVEDSLIEIVGLVFRVTAFQRDAAESEPVEGIGYLECAWLGSFFANGNGCDWSTRLHGGLQFGAEIAEQRGGGLVALVEYPVLLGLAELCDYRHRRCFLFARGNQQDEGERSGAKRESFHHQGVSENFGD